MNVRWTDTAARHLQGIFEHIAQDSPRYALAMVDRLTEKVAPLGDFPRLGVIVREYGEDGIRELVEHPYRIIYEILEDRIDVLAVIHGARRLPASPPR